MATATGTYVEMGLSTTDRVNAIVDVMLFSNIVEFRQITIYHERATRQSATTVNFTYRNWNPSFPTQVFLNNNPTAMVGGFTTSSTMGIITIPTLAAGDTVTCTYNFDYFPINVLEGFIVKAIDVLNVAPIGATTDYDIGSAPTNWDGVISDLVMAMCMEKLILDYDLWKGRLVFAIGPAEITGGSSDIVSQLQTIKQNCEERAQHAMDNPNFKAPHGLIGPTKYYYQSLMTGSGGSRGAHGIMSMGKLRGFRPNKYLGRILP